MPTMKIGADEFSTGCELIDVTSMHRPDTGWRVVDAQGHEHHWYVNGHPATRYRPENKHETPTLTDVHDGWGYYPDGERYAIHHFECSQCGEHIQPGYTADTHTQYIPGLRWCEINGEPVTLEEFERRWHEAQDDGA
jgi:hypothetical protein